MINYIFIEAYIVLQSGVRRKFVNDFIAQYKEKHLETSGPRLQFNEDKSSVKISLFGEWLDNDDNAFLDAIDGWHDGSYALCCIDWETSGPYEEPKCYGDIHFEVTDISKARPGLYWNYGAGINVFISEEIETLPAEYIEWLKQFPNFDEEDFYDEQYCDLGSVISLDTIIVLQKIFDSGIDKQCISFEFGQDDTQIIIHEDLHSYFTFDDAQKSFEYYEAKSGRAEHKDGE